MQRCKTCAHPEVETINKQLVGNVAYRRIAIEFGLVPNGVERHAKNHLQPIINEANEAAKVRIADRVLKFRDEVNYAIVDKVRFLQHQLLSELDHATDDRRVALYREYRGALQEEAKLGGLYQKDGINKSDLERTAEAYKSFIQSTPGAEDESDRWLGMFAEISGVDPSELGRHVQTLGMVG